MIGCIFNFPERREEKGTSILQFSRQQKKRKKNNKHSECIASAIHTRPLPAPQMSYYALNWFQENLLKDVLKEEVFSYLFSKMNSNSVKQTIMQLCNVYFIPYQDPVTVITSNRFSLIIKQVHLCFKEPWSDQIHLSS